MFEAMKCSRLKCYLVGIWDSCLKWCIQFEMHVSYVINKLGSVDRFLWNSFSFKNSINFKRSSIHPAKILWKKLIWNRDEFHHSFVPIFHLVDCVIFMMYKWFSGQFIIIRAKSIISIQIIIIACAFLLLFLPHRFTEYCIIAVSCWSQLIIKTIIRPYILITRPYSNWI